MLRINQEQSGQQNSPKGRRLLILEGQLVGPWVDELRGAAGGAESVELDLAGVTFADDQGVAALRDLRGAGARLVRASAFLAALIGVQGQGQGEGEGENAADRRVD